jgi:hypothetical protein
MANEHDLDRFHPWDERIDSGLGWTDHLVTEYDGKAVFATVNIDGPENRIEHVRVVFPAGSRLYLGVDASEPVRRAFDAGEVSHPFHIDDDSLDAYRIFRTLIQPMHDKASIKEVDTDL